jgi:hypothetical protein
MSFSQKNVIVFILFNYLTTKALETKKKSLLSSCSVSKHQAGDAEEKKNIQT